MGSKHDLLTVEEMATFTPPSVFIQVLERYRERVGKRADEIAILDWGCGRGRLVGVLLREGYDSYGIDIDEGPVLNGRPYFHSQGWDADVRLQIWVWFISSSLCFTNFAQRCVMLRSSEASRSSGVNGMLRSEDFAQHDKSA